MIGKTVSHYNILEKIGEGGMGVVYKAEDTKLKRIVAVKFLSQREMGTDEEKTRFVHEVRAAASLNHSNICTIYEIDTYEGQIFIAMEYVEGRNLKDMITSGSLTMDEMVDITIQVAEGLKEAHERGIVHHSIKPTNIMLTPKGQAKIMDFGLTKSLGKAQFTGNGITVGTSAYMSPESALGENADHRADIWSVGVTLYEMVTGELPFKGVYAQAVMYSVLNEDPIPPSDLNPEVPAELVGVIEKAMQKETDRRYQHMRVLLEDLKNLRQWVVSGEKAIKFFSKKDQPSIAVLPFADMSPAKDHEYFCDGIAEQIISTINQIEGLQVVSRTSAFAFKGRSEDVRDIGKKLGVETILEGSVRKAGNQLRIAAQLTSVADGYALWSGQFDRELEDIFLIQDEIAENIMHALEVELSEKDERILTKAATKDYQAYDFYLQGRQFYHQTHRKGIDNAIEMFENAIEKDPNYALAYAGLADCYSYLFSFFDSDKSNLDKAIALSHKALELDQELAEARVARGRAFYYSNRYAEAEREYEIAIQLNPNLYIAYESYARNSYSQGDLEKAAKLFVKALEIDPKSFNAPLLLAQTYRVLNEKEKDKEALQIGLENVRKYLELNPDDARALYMNAIGLAVAGEKELAFERIERALSIDPDDPMILYGAACVYALTFREEEAITMLERALSAGCSHRDWVERDPDFDSLRNHPRFKDLLERLD